MNKIHMYLILIITLSILLLFVPNPSTKLSPYDSNNVFQIATCPTQNNPGQTGILNVGHTNELYVTIHGLTGLTPVKTEEEAKEITNKKYYCTLFAQKTYGE
ncbi:MAG: hypothetical protein Q8P57_03350 [Candidatus Pacearchaeota archaeon]|nr:hypothetical protein [Candidatus Pacearchaeota archaeon]